MGEWPASEAVRTYTFIMLAILYGHCLWCTKIITTVKSKITDDRSPQQREISLFIMKNRITKKSEILLEL